MRPTIISLWLLVLAPAVAAGQGITIVETYNIKGTVESVSSGSLVVKDQDGKAHKLLIQGKGNDSVPLSTGQNLRFSATVKVTGSYPSDTLKKGQQIRFEAMLNRLGASDGTVSELWLVAGGDSPPGVKVVEEAEKRSGHAKCQIVGEVSRLTKGRLLVRVPRSDFTRKTTLAFELAEDAKVRMQSDDYRRAGPGAKATVLASRMNTGDVVVKQLDVDVTAETVGRRRVDDALALKYRNLSDEPGKPRQIRSKHFVFKTDISDRQARILLDKLETMVTLLSAYFGRQPRGVAQGYIVRDLSQWPDGELTEPQGIAKIQSRAGICFNRSLGSQRQSVIYACDDHGVVQHEATHAFCHLTFGSTGPTWLAEGIAEMGQYWKADQKAVEISPVVMNYLQQTSPKRTLLEIAVPGRVPAGGWQDYAWRWALCYLLANNPNYESYGFKPLAIALMSGQKNVSFASVYGPVAKQISFEYDLFLQTVSNGYRADLCAWQWNRKSKPLAGTRLANATIHARYGWQATSVRVTKGESYDVAAKGAWKIAQDGAEYEADGDRQGRGRLLGAVFADFKLSPPFELGKRKSFTAPENGDLYVRCRDDWNKLEDNDGTLTVHFRLTPEKTPEKAD